MVTYPDFGRCLYCPSTEGLTDEHIIPVSLGGKRILPSASCPACQKHTTRFEAIVAREMYGMLRLRLGIQGSRKRRKQRPTNWPVSVHPEGQNPFLSNPPISSLPLVYFAPVLPAPGIKSGEPISDGHPSFDIKMVGSRSELRKFTKSQGSDRLELSGLVDVFSFARVIAKIGHAFAAAEVGLDGIEQFLPPIILGAETSRFHYVGGVTPDVEPLPPKHRLALGFFELNSETFLTTVVRPIDHEHFPTYEAVVGRVTDRDLISRKTAAAAQRIDS